MQPVRRVQVNLGKFCSSFLGRNPTAFRVYCYADFVSLIICVHFRAHRGAFGAMELISGLVVVEARKYPQGQLYFIGN